MCNEVTYFKYDNPYQDSFDCVHNVSNEVINEFYAANTKSIFYQTFTLNDCYVGNFCYATASWW